MKMDYPAGDTSSPSAEATVECYAIKAINLQQKGFTDTSYNFAPFCTDA